MECAFTAEGEPAGKEECGVSDIPKQDRAVIVAFLRTLIGEYQGRSLFGQAVAE